MLKPRTFLLGIMLLAAAFFLPITAQAQSGEGEYRVRGVDARSGQPYSGSVTLSQTSADTWLVKWRIGRQSWTGYGIGNSKVIAINYTGGSTGVVLLIEKETGRGYKAVWANSGDKVLGTEDWTPTD
jgi:hypothetical protein